MIQISDEIRTKYQALKNSLTQETKHLSTRPMAKSNQKYLELLAMGLEIIPLLLEDLQCHHQLGAWDCLSLIGDFIKNEHLPNIAIPIDHQGCISELEEDYLAWGRENGYIS